ncbi:polysaccharide biosynthesis/export family protein [Sphingomonas sp. RS6]
MESVPRGAAAYAALQPTPEELTRDYVIGPLDTLDIGVFQEPDLTMKAVPVDVSGNISMPLIRTVQAAGLTTDQLAREIQQKLLKYYVRPEVTVVVASSVSQRVTVQGQVEEPGVYDLKGPTTLLNVIALAHGENRTAAMKEVVVFRTVDSRRMAAVFDLGRIRRGEDPDPKILGNDIVVVGYSNVKGLWRDILQAAPLLNVFRFYAD